MRPYSLARGAGFVALYFFALPAVLVALNDGLGWPRMRAPVFDVVGTLLIVVGVGVCAHCARLFWAHGRGTPVPTEPPAELVAYIAIALGIFLVEGHAALVAYPVVLYIPAELYLVKVEEPRLAERFGAPYRAYCRRVPRWPWSRTAR